MTLSWLAPEDDGGSPITGYYIHYHLIGTANAWAMTSLISEELNLYQVTGLTANSQYSFKITAVNVKGQSEQSGILYQYAGAVASSLV